MEVMVDCKYKVASGLLEYAGVMAPQKSHDSNMASPEETMRPVSMNSAR